MIRSHKELLFRKRNVVLELEDSLNNANAEKILNLIAEAHSFYRDHVNVNLYGHAGDLGDIMG
jgi:hypothetical protein